MAADKNDKALMIPDDPVCAHVAEEKAASPDSDETAIDEAVRTEAALLEQDVRDEMHLPEVLDMPTRELVRQAREAGCRVRLQSDAPAGIPSDRVCAIIQAALLVEPWPRELTLSVYAEAEQSTVAVVAVPGCAARRQAIERTCGRDVAVLEDDQDATWAEIRLGGRRPSGRATSLRTVGV